MKFLSVKMFAFMALLSVTGYSFGHVFGVSNKTKKTLVVRVTPREAPHVIYDVVRPNKRIEANLGGALCILAIQAAEFDPQEKFEGNNYPQFDKFKGKNLMEIKEMGGRTNPDVYTHVFAPLAKESAFLEAKMVMQPSKLYKDTAVAATALVSGIDDFACKATDIALAYATGGASEAAKAIQGIVNRPESEAAKAKLTAAKVVSQSRQNPEDPNKKNQAEQAVKEAQLRDKLVKIDKVGEQIGGVIIDDKFEYITKPVPVAIKAFETLKGVIDDKTYNTIKALFDKGSNEDAIGALEDHAAALKKTSTPIKILIDDTAVIHKCSSCNECNSCNHGCSSCDINDYLDLGTIPSRTPARGLGLDDDLLIPSRTTPLTTRTTDTAEKRDKAKTCSFGLGEIAGAAGELAGISICKNREFIIYETNEEQMIEAPGGGKMGTGHKALVAATDQGS